MSRLRGARLIGLYVFAVSTLSLLATYLQPGGPL